MLKKYFITLEGIEGSGKSTALQFIHQWMTQNRIPHQITREPGGTDIAEKIRQLFLTPHHEVMCSDAELLLLFAGRAQHLSHTILPALKRGEWVICDRFTDATYAYQGGGRGISFERIAELEAWVQGKMPGDEGYIRPDKVLLFDLPPESIASRIQARGSLDRIEQEKISFFERVRQAYLLRALQQPDCYTVIDATRSLEQVRSDIIIFLESL